MPTTLTSAEVQARQIRIAATANGLDAKGLWRRLRRSGLDISYERIRRAYYGERKSELDRDVVRRIAEETGFPVAWIRGDSFELPEWVLNGAKGVWLRSQLAAAAA